MMETLCHQALYQRFPNITYLSNVFVQAIMGEMISSVDELKKWDFLSDMAKEYWHIVCEELIDILGLTGKQYLSPWKINVMPPIY